jgi:hypothetical protein
MKELFVLISMVLCLTGCTTYSVSMIHSEGVSEDTLSDSQTLTPTTNASATVPISALPSASSLLPAASGAAASVTK